MAMNKTKILNRQEWPKNQHLFLIRYQGIVEFLDRILEKQLLLKYKIKLLNLVAMNYNRILLNVS